MGLTSSSRGAVKTRTSRAPPVPGSRVRSNQMSELKVFCIVSQCLNQSPRNTRFTVYIYPSAPSPSRRSHKSYFKPHPAAEWPLIHLFELGAEKHLADCKLYNTFCPCPCGGSGLPLRYLPSLLLDDLLHLRHLLLHLHHLLARVPALLRHRLHPHRLLHPHLRDRPHHALLHCWPSLPSVVPH